jgi:hypothetical protein
MNLTFLANWPSRKAMELGRIAKDKGRNIQYRQHQKHKKEHYFARAEY